VPKNCAQGALEGSIQGTAMRRINTNTLVEVSGASPKGPDKNIDHRRVPNRWAFFKRRGWELPVSESSPTRNYGFDQRIGSSYIKGQFG
jgi:hypothetical protein